MDVLDLCPTEDTVQALLDYLVDPMLPARSSLRDMPCQSQQQSVAQQVNAVVLLYNYYHRKKHPHLEHLGFESFCKLAVVLKPTMLAHMKLMQRCNDAELDDLGKQLSLMEKTVMDACDICVSLDASKDVPSTEGCPISKVTIFLVDWKKENCYLQFSSITQGVWSLIEKAIDVPDYSSEGTLEGKHINKKKRVNRKSLRDELNVNELGFQQLAFSAVKEATGINQSDLIILESHVVYSLSKEKAFARFYIMQRTLPNNDDLIQISIKDVIDSLQGPLVRKSSSGWTVTPVVEYFHVLPYAGIVSDWLSSSNSLQGQRLESGSANDSGSERTKKSCDPEVQNCRDRSVVDRLGSSVNSEPLMKNDNTGCPMNGFPSAFSGPHNMGVGDSSMVHSQNDDICKNVTNEVLAANLLKRMKPCMEGDLNATSSAKVKVKIADSRMVPYIAEFRGEEVENGKVLYDGIVSDQDGVPIGNRSLATYQSNSKNLNRIQATIASKEAMLSQTALRALHSKRDKLTLQLRYIEDEIAQCDKKMQIILNDGEDNLAIKIDSIIEVCNDVCLGSVTQQMASQHSLDKCAYQCIKRKRLSEAVLNVQNPCQELDGICCENNWTLPTYRVSLSDGGFQAKVSLKGVDFECTTSGDQKSNACEARESAAAQLLAKLCGMPV